MTTSPNININIVNQNVSNLVVNNERNKKYDNDISYRKLYQGNSSSINEKPLVANNQLLHEDQ